MVRIISINSFKLIFKVKLFVRNSDMVGIILINSFKLIFKVKLFLWNSDMVYELS